MSGRDRVVVSIDPDDHRGPVDRRLFGALVEHMGRCVYTGIFEPEHPTADTDGFRTDVAELVEELGVTLVRYPGGNFVSGYDWTDGIGPRERRPRRLDLAWRSIETNQVGTDDFLGWTTRLGLEPMLAVNLGTKGVTEAAALVEYCNLPGGTEWSDRRRANGSADPHHVRLWCLGNEMDGPWQLGHTSADRYAEIAAQAARAMRMVDPTVELVACGSSFHAIPTFGSWESTVLERAGDDIDFLSMHAYYEEHDGDRDSFLASGAAMDSFIDAMAATIDAASARRRTRRRLHISFDEWNVWYQSRFAGAENLPIDVSGPRIEDVYSTVDAVVVGDLLSTLLNHADRVKIACLAQLVNVIAPIMTEAGGPTWRQPTFHPFGAVAANAHGDSLVTRTTGPTLATRRHGDVPAVNVAATHDAETAEVAVFLTNRGAEPLTVELRHAGFENWRLRSVDHLPADDHGPRPHQTASTVRLTPLPHHSSTGRSTELTLPARSWTSLRAGVEPAADGALNPRDSHR